MPIRRTRAVPAAGIPDALQTKGSPEFVRLFTELRETAFTDRRIVFTVPEPANELPPRVPKNPCFEAASKERHGRANGPAPRRARCMAAVELTHCMSDEAYNLRERRHEQFTVPP